MNERSLIGSNMDSELELKRDIGKRWMGGERGDEGMAEWRCKLIDRTIRVLIRTNRAWESILGVWTEGEK